MKHFKLKVSGKVQGVFFRDSTRTKARELGVTGFVRNEKDGSVYIEAEGIKDQLLPFLDWVKRGPEQARVDKVVQEEGPIQGFPGFEIRY